MDLYQLKTFFTFGKVKSFTQTAKLMFVTQSAISHSIKKLEQSVETKLIKKSGQIYTFTDAGKDLFQSCEKIFYEIEKAEDKLKLHRDNPILEITLGSTVEFGTTILIKHIQTFLKKHTNIHIDFLFSNNLSNALISDKVDFIIDCKDYHNQNLEKIPLFNEQYTVIASPEYLNEYKKLKLRDLQDASILSLDKNANWWNNFLFAIPAINRPVFNNIMQVNHIRGMINGAIEGIGISFVPKYTVINEIKSKTLIEIFPEITPKSDLFNIFIKKNKISIYKNKTLIDYLKKIHPIEFGDSNPK